MPFSVAKAGSPAEVKASVRGQRSPRWQYAWAGEWWGHHDDWGHRNQHVDSENISEETLVLFAPVH